MVIECTCNSIKGYDRFSAVFAHIEHYYKIGIVSFYVNSLKKIAKEEEDDVTEQDDEDCVVGPSIDLKQVQI